MLVQTPEANPSNNGGVDKRKTHMTISPLSVEEHKVRRHAIISSSGQMSPFPQDKFSP